MSINRAEFLGILTAKEPRATQDGKPYCCFQIVTEYLYHALDTGKAEYSKDIIDLVTYRPFIVDRLKRIQRGSWVYVLARVVQLRRHSNGSAAQGIPYLSVINVMQQMAPRPDQMTALPMADPELEMPKFTRKRMLAYLAWLQNHPEAERDPLEQTVTHQADDGAFVPGAAPAGTDAPPFALPGPPSDHTEPPGSEPDLP